MTEKFGAVGVGTTNPGVKLKVVGDSLFDSVGIGTTVIQTDPEYSVGSLQVVGDKIRMIDSQLKFDFSRTSQVGFGTNGDSLSGSIDLRLAGENNISPWVFLPVMTTSTRDTKTTATGQDSTGIGTGAIIFNKTSNRVEIYLPGGSGTARVGDWVGVSTEN